MLAELIVRGTGHNAWLGVPDLILGDALGLIMLHVEKFPRRQCIQSGVYSPKVCLKGSILNQQNACMHKLMW